MNKCLNKEEFEKLIDLKAKLNDLDEEDYLLSIMIDNAENWQDKLVGLSYFLSQILERKLKKNIGCDSLIKLVYSLPDEMWFSIQEFDVNFIDYMMSCEHKPGLSLEERLIETQYDLDEYRYGRTFRY
ncbi:hypothetical protein KA005_17315 [bacterium]|nr:hypothetical protein [bacterium]